VALGAGATLWLFLLVVGFSQPGGWVWGVTGAIGHMDRFVAALWLVTLVLAPLLACRDPIRHRAAMDVYLLGVLGIVISDFHNEPPWLFTHARYIAAAALTSGLILWAHL
jgi:hypothetical protein